MNQIRNIGFNEVEYLRKSSRKEAAEATIMHS